MLDSIPVQSQRHCCRRGVLYLPFFAWVSPAANVSTPGGGAGMNGILFRIVTYLTSDIHDAVCPYSPPPLSVVMDAAFSMISSISMSMASHSGLPVILSIWCSCLGNPFKRVATDGAIFMMNCFAG